MAISIEIRSNQVAAGIIGVLAEHHVQHHANAPGVRPLVIIHLGDLRRHERKATDALGLAHASHSERYRDAEVLVFNAFFNRK